MSSSALLQGKCTPLRSPCGPPTSKGPKQSAYIYSSLEEFGKVQAKDGYRKPYLQSPGVRVSQLNQEKDWQKSKVSWFSPLRGTQSHMHMNIKWSGGREISGTLWHRSLMDYIMKTHWLESQQMLQIHRRNRGLQALIRQKFGWNLECLNGLHVRKLCLVHLNISGHGHYAWLGNTSSVFQSQNLLAKLQSGVQRLMD